MREDADIAAAENRDAGSERRLEAGALADDRFWFGLLSFLPARILRGGVARGECRTERDVTLGHQLEDIRRSAVAMLDRIDARHDRIAHALRARCMRRHRRAARVRRANAGRQ